MNKMIRSGMLWVIILAFALSSGVGFFMAEAAPLTSPETRPFERMAQDDEEAAEPGSFRLPASLKVIEAEAFEGTAAERVYLEEDVQEIGDRAFAANGALREIYIPGEAKLRGREIFAGADEVTVNGIEGSPAEDWAKEQGIPFRVQDIWKRDAVPHSNPGQMILLLLLALIPFPARGTDFLRTKQIIFAAEKNAIGHRRRAELFARDLCFP